MNLAIEHLATDKRVAKSVGIIQSNYIPWRGYFDFIKSVDLFVVFDCLQYTTFDWRNRNQIKTDKGLHWLSVPVDASRSRGDIILNTKIKYNTPWVEDQMKWLRLAYGKAPFFDLYFSPFVELLNSKFTTISQLNCALIRWINKILEIPTEIKMSTDLNPQGTKTDRLIDILRKVGATKYVSGPNAKPYMDVEKFKKENISLEYKSYSYREYPQLHGPFNGTVTVLDLLFNCGPEAKNHISSLTENEKILEFK